MQEPIHLLPAGDRARRYRALAEEMEATVLGIADSRHLTEIRRAYEKLALQWRALAEDAERREILPPQLANDPPLNSDLRP